MQIILVGAELFNKSKGEKSIPTEMLLSTVMIFRQGKSIHHLLKVLHTELTVTGICWTQQLGKSFYLYHRDYTGLFTVATLESKVSAVIQSG